MDTTQINNFIQVLKRVRRQPANLADTGLIVKEPHSKVTLKAIKDNIGETVSATQIVYDGTISDEDVLKSLVESFKNNSWVVVEVKKDIGSELLNQLQHLANSNNLQIMNLESQELFEMNMPGNVRVIVLADRNFIENHISYPHFYKLFGPTLSI